MPNAIQGDDVQLYLSEGEGSAGYTLVGCGRDLSLSLNNSFLSISDFTPDAYKVLPTFTNATISAGTLFIINPDDTALSSVVLMNWANEKTLLNWRIITTDFECSGQCYIQTWTLNASYNTVADVAMDCIVNGKVTINSEVPCIAVTFDSITLPDGAVGIPYSSSFPISGTAPFNITGVTKPSWMSIEIVDGEVVISGTPDADGTGLTVAFTIENCSGDSAAFSDTIDISSTCVGVAIVGTPDLPDGTVGGAYSYSFGLTGTAPFSLDNITKPSWMTIAVDGNNVVFSGTPSTEETGLAVSFDILNPCGATDFADTFDVGASTFLLVRLSNNDDVICGESIVAVYIDTPDLGIGTMVYFDEGHTMLINSDFIVKAGGGTIWSVIGGVVDGDTTFTC